MNYKHYVITRFNVRTIYKCRLRNPNDNPMLKILDEDYLEKRFMMFEKYTLKAMNAQTNKDFSWIILFHKRTPKKFLNKIQELKKIYDFEDLYFDNNEGFVFSEYCDKNNENYDFYLTTRIDNDDLIDKNFVKYIHDYVEDNLKECFISFYHGAKIDLRTNEIYDSYRKGNMQNFLISI